MISDIQKRAAQAIVNIFETGSALGDHGNVTVLSGDPGHLTYGRSQTTLASGNLYLLLKAYVDAPGAAYADALRPFLPRVQARDLSLDGSSDLRSLLRQAGTDPVMRDVQDGFFDRVYWSPAMAAAQSLSIATALGCCVVYDSVVHGSFVLIRDRTNGQIGAIGSGGVSERDWVTRYIATRREWLASSANKLLRKTVYRIDAIQQIIVASNWDLALPLTVRGVLIDETVLAGHPVRVSAHLIEQRLLMLVEPMMQGDDVAGLQQALTAKGLAVKVDGIFGPATEGAVRAFQKVQRLTADGAVGPATRSALGL